MSVRSLVGAMVGRVLLFGIARDHEPEKIINGSIVWDSERGYMDGAIAIEFTRPQSDVVPIILWR